MFRGVYPQKLTDFTTSTFSSQRLLNAGTLSRGEYLTRSTQEFTASLAPYLKEDGVCSLSDVLLPPELIPPKYYLSRTACLGILRRAASRGKGFTADAERSVGETSRGVADKRYDGQRHCRVCQEYAYGKIEAEVSGGSASDVQCMPDKNKLQCVVCYASGGFGLKVESEVASTLSTDHDDRVTGNNAALIQTFQKVSRPKGPDGLGERWDKSEVSATLNVFDNGDKRMVDVIAHVENAIGRQPQNGGNGDGFSEELAYTQNATGVMGACDLYNGSIGDDCPTLRTASATDCTHIPGVASTASVRRLLPIECERLMGFPDNWTRISWKGNPEEECPDSPRYKACGNSMCVNVMRWIGLRIERVLKGEKNE